MKSPSVKTVTRVDPATPGRRGSGIVSVLFLATTLLSGSVAFAAHPLITDDAGTLGANTGQLELNYEYGRDKEDSAGVLSEETTNEIAAAIAYGLTDGVDIVLGLPHQWTRSEEDGVKIGEKDGLGDTSLELKWRFHEDNGWSLAVKPGISLPTGDEEQGFGNGRTSYSVVFITTRTLRAWAFHLNLGYVANGNKVGDRNDLWQASLAGEVGFTERLKAVANLGMETNPDPASDTHPAFALAGLIWSVADNLDFDLGVKGGLNDAETDITGLAGLALRF